MGAISLAQLLPVVLFGPLFGTLLDRHDHRRYALGVNMVLALLAAVLYLLTASHAMRIELLLLMAVLGGIANSAYQAVRLAMVNDVVQPVHLASAIAINSVLFNLSRIIGPAIAGIITSILLGTMLLQIAKNLPPQFAAGLAASRGGSFMRLFWGPPLYAAFGALGGFLSMQFFFKDRLKT